MQDSLLYLKNLFLSLLAMIGLASNQEIQEHKPTDLSDFNQSQGIIDINPVSNPEITPEDLARIKMFSESVCGPMQAQLQGIITMNTALIDNALQKGADINKSTNCIYPLDEAIEGAISRDNPSVVVHLCKHGAVVSSEQIMRLHFKQLALETNKIADGSERDLVVPTGLPKNASEEERTEQMETTNDWIDRKKIMCHNLMTYLHRVHQTSSPASNNNSTLAAKSSHAPQQTNYPAQTAGMGAQASTDPKQ